MDEIGQRLIEILQEVYVSPRTVQCDFIRINAAYVAAAASIGFITTKTPDGEFSRKWRITEAGLRYLRTFT